MSNKDLGTRIKSYECKERFSAETPLIIRIDGKCFSSFTKGLKLPYDARLRSIMVKTTAYLMSQTSAKVGYTQSDEISLVLLPDNPHAELFFGGKKQKIVSVLASMATGQFNTLRKVYLPDFKPETLALFDCRAFQVPSREEATQALIWRQQDAIKNAISAAARCYISAKRMYQTSDWGLERILKREFGVNFKDYPSFFKQGTLLRRERKLVCPEDLDLESIPEKYRPTSPVVRYKIDVLDTVPLQQLENATDVIFNQAEPNFLT